MKKKIVVPAKKEAQLSYSIHSSMPSLVTDQGFDSDISSVETSIIRFGKSFGWWRIKHEKIDYMYMFIFRGVH